MDERGSESCLYMELDLNLFVIEGEGLSENGHLLKISSLLRKLLAAAQLCDSSVGM